ncbi:MAG: RNA polymerase sigma factor SigZ [Planctomycetota bacterium]
MNATQKVWDEFSTSLRSFIRRRVQDDSVADDLLQEVFVRIHDRMDSLNDEDRIAPWVFQIARNAITDHYRRKREVELGDHQEQPESESEVQNLNAEVGNWLADRIEELPDEYRSAVRLAEMEGVKQKEIAARSGLSISGAKSRVQRGRKLLKDQLLQCCHFEFDRRGNVIDYKPSSNCSDCCGLDGCSSGS